MDGWMLVGGDEEGGHVNFMVQLVCRPADCPVAAAKQPVDDE